jgi:hypothetical protein
MLNRNKTRLLLCLLVLSATFAAVSLWACSVPVFRYAMEHWPADLYQAIVFHRGLLSEAQLSLVRELSTDGMAGRLHANVSLRTIDLDQNPAPDVLEFWRGLSANTSPWLVLRYPPASRLGGNIWSGPLAEPAIRPLLDSPARKEVARRLAHGQSAVWVLLEIGDQKKDAAAAALVEPRLAYLATVLKLPKLEEQDIVNGLISVGADGLRLEFSFLRLSRSDPAEQAFVKMLLGTEADLEETQEPIVFPIFGRGRALYALVGKGINHETIDEAASFIIGSCSCQVKDQNPGVDLLIEADWDTMLKSQAGTARSASASGDSVAPAPVSVTISGSEDAQRSSTSPSLLSPTRRISILGGLAVGALLAGGFLFLRRK